MRRLIKNNNGVGLVEAIVAIGILITGIISVTALSQSNIASSKNVESRLIAVNLAREGVEAVRSLRDGNWLKGYTNVTGGAKAWDTGFSSLGDNTAIAVLEVDDLSWSLDFTPNNITDNSARMRRHSSRGLYRQSTESPAPADETITPFFRLITIYAICHNYPGVLETNDTIDCPLGWHKAGVRVVSKVEWEQAGRRQNLEVESWLFNWRYGFTPYVN